MGSVLWVIIPGPVLLFFTSASLRKLPLPLGKSPFSRATISIHPPKLLHLPATPAVHGAPIPLNLHTSVHSGDSSRLGFKFQAQPQTWDKWYLLWVSFTP